MFGGYYLVSESGVILPVKTIINKVDAVASKNFWLNYYRDFQDITIIYKKKRKYSDLKVWELTGNYSVLTDGKLIEEGIISNNKLNGIRTRYHISGAIKSMCHYQDDRMNGLFERWDSAGNKVHESKYMQNKKQSWETYWNCESDTLLRIFWENGTPQKLCKYDNNEVIEVIEGKDAKRHLLKILRSSLKK